MFIPNLFYLYGIFSHISPEIFSNNLVLNIYVTFIVHEYTTVYLFLYFYKLSLQEILLNNLGSINSVFTLGINQVIC